MFQQFKNKKEYCPYFQYMSILSIALIAFMLISFAYMKKLDLSVITPIVSLMFVYFQNRLLYTMCMD